MKQFCKKTWHFLTHHNAPLIALELAIFVGIVWVLAAGPSEISQNSEMQVGNWNEKVSNLEQSKVGQASSPDNSNKNIIKGEYNPSLPTRDEKGGENSEGDDRDKKIMNLKKLEIKKIGPEKYAFETLENDIVEIGTERHSPPKPYLKLNRWDGEVWMKINMPYSVVGEPKIVGGKLRYRIGKESQTSSLKSQNFISKLKSKIFGWLISPSNAESYNEVMDIDFYPVHPKEIIERDSYGNEHKSLQNELGGVEFDTILYEKPTSNKITFPIETKGLKFYYQPPLTEEIKIGDENGRIVKVTETDAYAKDEKTGELISVNHSPENVVGSYAVYHESKSGDYSKMGGKNYRAGKAFHIYRPKITDANGNWTWGK